MAKGQPTRRQKDISRLLRQKHKSIIDRFKSNPDKKKTNP